MAGGRWNSPAHRVIYAADSYAAVMLEMLVHTRIGRVPASHRWIEIAIPKSVSVEIVDGVALPGWSEEDSGVARRFGDNWFNARRSVVLVVPSVVTGGLSRNLVIHQEHPEFAQLRASDAQPVVWDGRLFTG